MSHPEHSEDKEHRNPERPQLEAQRPKVLAEARVPMDQEQISRALGAALGRRVEEKCGQDADKTDRRHVAETESKALGGGAQPAIGVGQRSVRHQWRAGCREDQARGEPERGPDRRSVQLGREPGQAGRREQQTERAGRTPLP